MLNRFYFLCLIPVTFLMCHIEVIAVENIPSEHKKANEALPKSSKIARQELQDLLDQGLQTLASELVQTGSFYPFLLMLGHNGDFRLMGTPASLQEEPASAVVAALVKKSKILAAENRIRAVAFFMDYVAKRQDTGVTQAGIRVELNHLHPDALSVFVPYFITTDKKLRLMTPQFKPGKNLVFTGLKKSIP